MGGQNAETESYDFVSEDHQKMFGPLVGDAQATRRRTDWRTAARPNVTTAMTFILISWSGQCRSDEMSIGRRFPVELS